MQATKYLNRRRCAAGGVRIVQPDPYVGRLCDRVTVGCRKKNRIAVRAVVTVDLNQRINRTAGWIRKRVYRSSKRLGSIRWNGHSTRTTFSPDKPTVELTNVFPSLQLFRSRNAI